ncbi:MAG: hypothetical protein ABEL04_12460 [Salinibacter sp.]|uniref:hypothetical protein n=1 Tax=Salinibacter sp. TaxID=2065818 RepID=UPI0035D47B73
MPAVQRGKFVELNVEKFADGGTSVAHVDEVPVRVEEVIGTELVEDAVANARMSAEMNGVDNCTFVSGDLKDLLTPSFAGEHGRPDVLIVDPPRAGMHKNVVEQVATLAPERFVYVSCNPQTQACDLERLRDACRVDTVQPVDMFPHTPHVENVVRLTRATD